MVKPLRINKNSRIRPEFESLIFTLTLSFITNTKRIMFSLHLARLKPLRINKDINIV